MNEYMVVIRFTESYSEKFLALIPLQRMQVNYLMEKRIITGYSLSADRDTLWVTLSATSRERVEKTLRMMPLFKFMHYEIIDLMFHNSPIHESIHLSLN